VKTFKWQLSFGLLLIGISAAIYYIHYLLFNDLHDIIFYLIHDIAFVPIEVLLVTLIIHQLLDMREKSTLFKKLNMIIGSFFSEVGTKLLGEISACDKDYHKIKGQFIITPDWEDKDFKKAIKHFKNYNFTLEPSKEKLQTLKLFLKEKKGFLLRLLANPNLLEHDRFTDLLWAVHHLDEELIHRKDIAHLSANDFDHIVNDVKRAYSLLIIEWLAYMKHLKNDYPYLFSLAIRINPYDPSASPEIS